MARAEDEGDTYERRAYRLLEHAVRDELEVYSGLEELELSAEALDTLAWAVTARIDYAFDVRWAPGWVQTGPHVWSEAGGFQARCGTCLEDSPPQGTEESARDWHAKHVASQHGR